ncbi:hypothetical protein ACE6H2_006197 [Prunus campanulata]
MSELIRTRKAMTTAQPLPPPASTSAATAPPQVDVMPVSPHVSHVAVSSESSVAQPVSARRRHRPPHPHMTDTTLPSAAGASDEEEHPGTLSPVEDGEGHPGDQHSCQHRIRRATSSCTNCGPT